MDDMYDVSQALYGFIKAYWKVLGRQLGLKGNLLENINDKYRRNGAEECFSQVLEAWLKRKHDEATFGPPTWHSLADAVERSGDHDLAVNVLALL